MNIKTRPTMLSFRAPLLGTILLSILHSPSAPAQSQQTPPNTPTLQVTSRLVFLDVTVLDKKGNPVVRGLTKEDFTVTDNKQAQRIFSFEPPETHVMERKASDDNPSGKAPVTIFVLDLLNSRFEDFAYIRYSMQKYLAARQAQLGSPAELMLLGNTSLEMVQGFTRSKADLLSALNHVPPALPYKMNPSFFFERFAQSVDALQQIALQNTGVPGRKNIIWVGHGGPSINTMYLAPSDTTELNRYVHDTTNLMVNARVSLFLIYPGLPVNGPDLTMSEESADADIGETDPFAGDINFGVFVNETGGNLFYNRNDVDAEIQRSRILGSQYYTLTYQPPPSEPNGNFRRVRVTMRNPGLRVITKAGYFAPDEDAPIDTRQKAIVDIVEAARSTVPFKALNLGIENLVRHPDSGMIEFNVVVKTHNLSWQPAMDGSSTATLTLAAVSLSNRRDILASRMDGVTVARTPQQTQENADTAIARLPVKMRLPRKTKAVRVVIEAGDGGRIGSVEFDHSLLDAAPATATPEPKLIPQPLKATPPPPL
jgi:VWFA-related protein